MQETPRSILPFRSAFAAVGGYRMHYVDEGSGPVVVLLHGNPTWCFYYRKLIEELKPHFRVIAPDYIGMGLSDHPPDRHFRAAQRVEQLEEFVAQLGIRKLSLVMHDWGGPIGTSFAARHPEMIERLVYLNTTLTETESLPAIIKRAHLPIIGPLLTKQTMHFLRLMAEFGVVRALPADVREGYFHPYRTRARRTAIWDFVADIPFDSAHPSYTEMLGFAERLPELRSKPVLIVWGLRDPCFHREMLGKVQQHFPHAEVVEIPDASHLVLEDAPEIANAAIAGFLRGEPVRRRAEPEQSGEVNALYEAFVIAAEAAGRADAAVVPDFAGGKVSYSHATFQELRSTVHRYERGLAELGLTAGDRVLMLVPPGIEFLALSYAVMGRGGVPVYIDPGIGKANLLKCISDINPDVMIGTPRAQLLRLTGKRLLPKLKFSLTALDLPVSTGRDLAFLKKFSSIALTPARGEGMALVAFTSGATGTPKGVVFTNEMIREQLRIFRESLGFEAGGRDLPLLPIFSLFTVPLGITSVFPRINSAKPLSLDPERMVRIIQDLSITYSFGSPTLWNKLAEYCVRSGTELATVRRIFMAGAPVPPATLQRVQGVIPNGKAFTPYGATEALPVTLVDAAEITEAVPVASVGGEMGTLVGKPVPGVSVRIVRFEESDRGYGNLYTVLAPREIGEVVVKGKNVSPRYLNRPDADLKSKVHVGELLWHRMGDMGYFDEEGNLYFCGRRAHIVATEARTYYSIPTERIFNQHPKVRRSALVSIGKDAGIIIEPLPEYWPASPEAQRAFAEELRELAKLDPITERIAHVLFHPSFPVDSRHNAKIFRDKLSEWASGQLASLERAA